MRKNILIIVAVSAITAVCLGSCLDEQSIQVITPVPVIPVPTSLLASIGVNSVSLTWNYDTSYAYSAFNIYRSEDGGGSWERAGQVSVPPFVDTSVRFGVTYQYRVAGVSPDGVEGTRSTSLVVQLSIYSVVINNNETYTPTRNVTLGFTAPVGTQFVKFSEDSAFTGEAWRTFLTAYGFTLTSGDGTKFVYARFTDGAGNITQTVNDSIILDTQSAIQSFTHDATAPIPPQSTIHFIVTPVGTELDGSAQISLQNLALTITALDNGTGGDPTANDGIYEVDYTLPASYREVDAITFATFTDAAGNVSNQVEASDLVSITDPPAPVTIFPVSDSTETSISLRWSESTDANFLRYEIYRDLTSGVSNATSPRIQEIFDSQTLSTTDSDVTQGVTYYYRAYVVNDLQESSAGSNVRAAHAQNVPPTPVVCDTPTSVTQSTLTLTWSKNGDSDFASYEVYRATAPGVTDADVLVASITDVFTTFVDDSGLDTNLNTYYYRVYVVDTAGNRSRSNEVSTSP